MGGNYMMSLDLDGSRDMTPYFTTFFTTLIVICTAI